MKKLKLYLETSVISAVIDDREPEKKKVTQLLIDEIKKYEHETFISRVTLLEIEKADEGTREKLFGVVRDVNPEELEIGKETEILAAKYIKEGVIPSKYENDAIHIAIASVNDLDVVVSWNFEHIVRHKTRMEVMGINTLMGYRIIDICSPKEVVGDV